MGTRSELRAIRRVAANMLNSTGAFGPMVEIVEPHRTILIVAARLPEQQALEVALEAAALSEATSVRVIADAYLRDTVDGNPLTEGHLEDDPFAVNAVIMGVAHPLDLQAAVYSQEYTITDQGKANFKPSVQRGSKAMTGTIFGPLLREHQRLHRNAEEGLETRTKAFERILERLEASHLYSLSIRST